MDFQTFVKIIAFINGFAMLLIMFVVAVREITEKAQCFECKAPLKKYPKFHKFDARHVSEYKDGKIGKVCTKCLIKYLKEYFVNFKYKAAIIEPFKPFNAYEFRTIKIFKEIFNDNEKIESIKQLIKDGGLCIKCGKKTNLILYPPEIYSKNPYDFVINKKIDGNYYCANCLCDRVGRVIEREQIYFERVCPPREGGGVMSSFET